MLHLLQLSDLRKSGRGWRLVNDGFTAVRSWSRCKSSRVSKYGGCENCLRECYLYDSIMTD